MKALTLRQPWAALIFCGKKIETRSRLTHYRGIIAIHAAATLSESAQIWTHATPEIGAALYKPIKELPLGAVIGTVEIVDCLEIAHEDEADECAFTEADVQTPRIFGNEYIFGDYTPGRYAYILENPRMFKKPLPAKGQQGFWNWTPPEGGLQYANDVF